MFFTDFFVTSSSGLTQILLGMTGSTIPVVDRDSLSRGWVRLTYDKVDSYFGICLKLMLQLIIFSLSL